MLRIMRRMGCAFALLFGGGRAATNVQAPRQLLQMRVIVKAVHQEASCNKRLSAWTFVAARLLRYDLDMTRIRNICLGAWAFVAARPPKNRSANAQPMRRMMCTRSAHVHLNTTKHSTT